MNKTLNSSNKMNWRTPQWIFNLLDDEFHFTLDPCSDDENHKCEKFFTEEDNGLSQSWDNYVAFVNPPYGREIGKWVKKASESKGIVVMLIPARTDTKYWHEYIFNKASEIRFVKGRIKFELGDCKDPAPFPSAIIIYNKEEGTKYKTFSMEGSDETCD